MTESAELESITDWSRNGVSFALKGRAKPAQGNALGSGTAHPKPSPERAPYVQRALSGLLVCGMAEFPGRCPGLA